MNDYTPSTEEVRDALRDWEVSGDQFDRWLDQVRQEAAAAGYDSGYSHGLDHGREAAMGLDA